MPIPQPQKQLSPATRELVEGLYRSLDLVERFFRGDPRVEILHKIGDAGEPAAIPDLMPLVLTRSSDIARETTRVIERLLECVKPAEYSRFDEYLRVGDIDWKWRRETWAELQVQDVKQFAKLAEGAASLLGVLSCHSSGYIRESAVRELGKFTSGVELPFLLLRVNDWVGNVREIARALVSARIRLGYALAFLKWLPLVLRLRLTRRGKNEEIIERVKELFQSAEAAHLLEAGRNSEDRLARRFFYEASLSGRHEGEDALLPTALQDSDFHVRVIAARALEHRPPSAEAQRLLEAALRSRFSRVRHEALRSYAGKYREAAEAELKRALLDPDISIREEAQFYLNKTGTVNLRGFYIENVGASSGKTLASSLAGLGETGRKEDTAPVSQYLAAKQPQVRAAAIRAIAKLDPGYDAAIFLAPLSDESAKVRREALFGLQKRVNSVGGERLWEAFLGCKSPRAKRDVLFLIARLSRWESLGLLLQALGDPDNSVSEAAERYKARLWRRWNHSFVPPTKDQTENLRAILETHQLLISSGEKEQLKALLKQL
jgi:HEAT repeat protein